MFRPIEAVIRTHVEPGSARMIIIDQSYFGPYKNGDRVPVLSPAFEKSILVPGGSQPEMFLVLTRVVGTGYDGSPTLFGNGLIIDQLLSRRLSDGHVYFWNSSTKPLAYNFWRLFTNTASLTRDETHVNIAALETDLADGLARHDEWTRAQEASDPALKLSLLRTFLLPGGKHQFTPYDIWACSTSVLKEVEKAGPASVPFLNELLTQPTYGEDYVPNGWRGFGSQERAQVKKSLALVESLAATSSHDKLARLRPLFDVPKFETVAGFDPVGLLGQYMDRGLSAVTTADANEARLFLKGLLDLPQFQESYSPNFRMGFGHDERVKIEAALARLQ